MYDDAFLFTVARGWLAVAAFTRARAPLFAMELVGRAAAALEMRSRPEAFYVEPLEEPRADFAAN